MHEARHAPATARNREALLEVLRRHFPERGLVVEVGSGTGEHTAFFSQHFDELEFQPTDVEPENHGSVCAHTRDLPNVRPPLQLDAAAWPWPIEAADVLLAINVIHISPPEVLSGLMRGAGELLSTGGLLFTYGPYRIGGEQTAPSNAQFELWLKSLDPRFGVRDLEQVMREAEAHELEFVERVAMPANNFTLVFRRR